MEAKKYISITYGILKFSNGKKIGEGDFVPADVSDEDIREKLKRKQIAVFDNKIAAVVQASNKDGIDIVKQLKDDIKCLKEENDILNTLKNDLEIEIESLKSEMSAMAAMEVKYLSEVEDLKDQLKKAGKK